jgi:indole-3-glycerol phosphate synthase
MQTILERITDRIREREEHNFRMFSPGTVIMTERTAPVDILSMMEEDFFVIAETKKGSPSKGIIREDYNPAALAAAYRRAGASAVSVITEEDFFYGSKQHLTQVKEVVDLPVLRKDFLVHPFQVYESYNLGADFILLIVACLTDEELQKLYSLSLSLGMQVLIEVHNKWELERALALNPPLIGINNRDLRTFTVDLETSFYLKGFIPEDIHVISESGIKSKNDIESLKLAGFSGALIGESLLRHYDAGRALKRMMSEE